MSSCTPSFSSNELDAPDGCEEACHEKSFSVVSVTSDVLDDGSCQFDYSVKETTGSTSTTHTGSANVACGSSTTVTYYCDDEEQCPLFELHLNCVDE